MAYAGSLENCLAVDSRYVSSTLTTSARLSCRSTKRVFCGQLAEWLNASGCNPGSKRRNGSNPLLPTEHFHQVYRGIAKLVKALDFDSSIPRFESLFLCQFHEVVFCCTRRGIAKLVKAPDFDSGIPRFESLFPCHHHNHTGQIAQLVEQSLDRRPVLGSNPSLTTSFLFNSYQLTVEIIQTRRLD